MVACFHCSVFISMFLYMHKSTCSKNDNEKIKRLLLTDPDVMAARFNALEKGLQEVRQSMAQMQSENDNLKRTVSHLQTNLNHGSTYIQWARKQCTSKNSEIIYTGFLAGQRYVYDGTHFGGPANMLCLPNNPELTNKTAPGSSHLYGAEFERNFFGPNAVDEDVPCSLCRSLNTTSSVMIPGRTTCYTGWGKEYSGILASGGYGHKASSYICIDGNPEYLQAGKANLNGLLVYATSTKCGSLPCPPYVDNQSVNCVVCSK